MLTPLAILVLAFTIHIGIRHMGKTVTDATADLTAAVTTLATDIAGALQVIADNISEHIANGTAATAIEAQAQRLLDLDTQLKAGENPAAPETTSAPAGDDTLTGPSGDDSISG